MFRRAGIRGTFGLAIVLAGAGCSVLKPRRAPRPFVPPPAVVRTMPPEIPLITDMPPMVGGVYADLAEIAAPNLGPPIAMPERPPAPPPRQRPTPAVPPTVELPVEPAPPPVQVPKLTRILTDEETRRYRGEVDQSTRTAEQVLEAASRRQLSNTQNVLAQQVRTFVRQAREQRDGDLVAARNLAGRALILARDLERTLR